MSSELQSTKDRKRPKGGNVVWDLDSGYCPHGHPLSECHGRYYVKATDSYANHCKLKRREHDRKYAAARKAAQPEGEWRCRECNAPLFAGRHVFGMGEKCGHGVNTGSGTAGP